MRPNLPALDQLRRLFQSRPFGNWEPGWKAVVATCLVVACAGAVVADQLRLAVNQPNAPSAIRGPAERRVTSLSAVGEEGPAPTGITPPAHPSW